MYLYIATNIAIHKCHDMFFNFVLQHLSAFMESLVKQMSINLKRIHSLGLNKISVGLLQPIGCLPEVDFLSLRMNCIDFFNSISKDYNKMLLQAVQELNKETSSESVFITLDLYNSFLSAIETMQKKRAG